MTNRRKAKTRMMKLTEQVITGEQARRLKELGVVQDSLFYWNHRVVPELTYKAPYTDMLEASSAFTVAELGLMLPRKIRLTRADYTFRINLGKSGIWQIKYRTLAHGGQMVPLWERHSISEAIARADMLIWLIEQGHTTPDEVNTRLQ